MENGQKQSKWLKRLNTVENGRFFFKGLKTVKNSLGWGDKSHHSQRDWPTEEDLRKKNASNGANRQIDRQTDIATLRLNWPSGPGRFSEK